MFEWLIRQISPGWAAKRALARHQLGELSELAAYRGATYRRQDRNRPTYRGASADWTNEQSFDRWEMVDRARQLERNSVLAEAILDASVLNVVGTGFTLQCRTDSKAWNDRVEALWKEWADHEADSRGMSTLDELLALKFRSYLRDGDAGTVLLKNGALRLVESDEITTPDGPIRPEKGVDGIDLDQQGKPTAYYILQKTRDTYQDRRQGTYEVMQIAPGNMVFLARRHRLGQTRGLSAFATVAWILDQIDGQIEAITVASRMAACFGLVFKREGRMPSSYLGTREDGAGLNRKNMHLEPGSFFELDPGETIEQIQPQHPHTDFGAFLRLLTRFVARPFGLPLEVTLLDASEVNYSSMRGNLLQAWQTWRCYQGMLRRYMSRLFRWKMAAWLEDGSLAGRAPANALAHTFMTPGWQWVDPQKEIEAAMMAAEAGLETRSSVAARLGVDFEENLQGLKREQEAAKKAGVKLRYTTKTQPEMPEQPAGGAMPMKPAGAKPAAK